MMKRICLVPIFLALAAGCAQVPKESVELSATVGRDLAEVHKAHRELAQLLFRRMRKDVNRFVDDVYAPHQIRFVMAEEQKKADSTDPAVRRKSLLLGINAAFKPGASSVLQKAVLEGMAITVEKIRVDVESMRSELLVPLDAQEAEVLGAIDRAYLKIHHANSIVTGHLSSVVKVHEAQAELLDSIGVEKDLRKEVGASLASASEQIGNIVEQAEKADKTLDKAKASADEIKATVNRIGKPVEAKK
jgi:hypothetical protein